MRYRDRIKRKLRMIPEIANELRLKINAKATARDTILKSQKHALSSANTELESWRTHVATISPPKSSVCQSVCRTLKQDSAPPRSSVCLSLKPTYEIESACSRMFVVPVRSSADPFAVNQKTACTPAPTLTAFVRLQVQRYERWNECVDFTNEALLRL